jgi:N-acetylglucosaminyldiphosphoundecaprenol N-acetyl-beta-D-mannosaminyltransferase
MAKWFDRVKDACHLIKDDSGRAANAPTRPLLPRSTWWLLTILLLWLPVSPFLVTVTGWRGVSAIRDIITLVLLIVAFLSRRRNQQPLIAGDVERLAVWLVVWSLITLALISHDAAAWVWSARYSFVPLALFWALHSYAITTFQWRRLLTVWLSWSGLLFIFGLAMVFIIPKDVLIAWGYSSTVAVGNGQWVGSAALPAYQAVAGGIPRLQATLTGPIQLAGFAAVVYFMLRTVANWQPSWFWQKALTVLTILMIIGTFSRSVWLALVLIGLVWGYRRLRSKGWRRRDLTSWGVVGLVAAIAIFGQIFMSPNNEGLRFSVGRILAREGSDSEHAASITDSLSDWPQIGLWGLGAGRSGPGSIQYAAADPQAPLPRFVDNSYLRWWEELGIPGAALFLSLIWILISELRRAGPVGRNLAGAGLTLALAALLTDMWAEAVPLYTFLALAALWHQEPEPPTGELKIGRFTVSRLDLGATVGRLTGWTKHRDPHAVVTLNPEMYVAATKNESVAAHITQADLITADGAGIIAAADVARQLTESTILRWRWLKLIWLPFAWIWAGLRLIFAPNRLPLSRVTGTGLVEGLCTTANRDQQRVALIGSTAEVIARAKKNIAARWPKLQLAYAQSAPDFEGDAVPAKEAARFATELKTARADYLFIAFGVPRQEQFAVEQKRALGTPVIMGVSGAFDSVLAGTVRRPARLIQAVHLEWLWRLILQPKRLGRIWTATWRFMRVASRDILTN